MSLVYLSNINDWWERNNNFGLGKWTDVAIYLTCDTFQSVRTGRVAITFARALVLRSVQVYVWWTYKGSQVSALWIRNEMLGTFSKLRKLTNVRVISVFLSNLTEHLGSHWTYFLEIWFFFLICPENSSFVAVGTTIVVTVHEDR